MVITGRATLRHVCAGSTGVIPRSHRNQCETAPMRGPCAVVIAHQAIHLLTCRILHKNNTEADMMH